MAGTLKRSRIGHRLLVACIALAMTTAGAAGKPPLEVSRLVFQSGVDGYDGTVNIELWALAPTTILDSNPNATTDANNDGGESQVLLRFERIIGDGPGQIPAGSAVRSATLVVGAFDQGDTVHLHRMLVPWPRQATWTTMIGGVTADGFRSLAAPRELHVREDRREYLGDSI